MPFTDEMHGEEYPGTPQKSSIKNAVPVAASETTTIGTRKKASPNATAQPATDAARPIARAKDLQ